VLAHDLGRARGFARFGGRNSSGWDAAGGVNRPDHVAARACGTALPGGGIFVSGFSALRRHLAVNVMAYSLIAAASRTIPVSPSTAKGVVEF
jgi:hypothetical protein